MHKPMSEKETQSFNFLLTVFIALFHCGEYLKKEDVVALCPFGPTDKEQREKAIAKAKEIYNKVDKDVLKGFIVGRDRDKKTLEYLAELFFAHRTDFNKDSKTLIRPIFS